MGEKKGGGGGEGKGGDGGRGARGGGRGGRGGRINELAHNPYHNNKKRFYLGSSPVRHVKKFSAQKVSLRDE